MKEMIKMVVVLVILSSFSGGILAAVRSGTQDKIEYQQLKFEKAPAIQKILQGVSNDPMTDRFKVTVGDREVSVFVGEFDGKRDTVVFEDYGKGFSGDIGLMVGVNLSDDSIMGIGVTTHSETPGVGSKAKTESSFAEQFKGLPLDGNCKVKDDGGQIDALSGATVTSKGVCIAVSNAGSLYAELKDQIVEQLSKAPASNQ